MIGLEGTLPLFCEPNIVEKVLNLHFSSPAMWSIIAIQDLLAIDFNFTSLISNPNDERVNIPSVRHHYWKYRIPVTLEELLVSNDFTKRIRSLIEKSGRLH